MMYVIGHSSLLVMAHHCTGNLDCVSRPTSDGSNHFEEVGWVQYCVCVQVSELGKIPRSMLL